VAGVAHKSDVGGVRLGVRGASAVSRAYAELAELSGGAVLVSELVDDSVAEMVIGASQDPIFGPVVAIGTGGVLVEVLGDLQLLVPPFGRQDVARAIDRLRGVALLRGFRGRPAADESALVDVVLRTQRLVLDLHAEIDELDINPLALRMRGQGAVALDALIVAR
jgi:acyl-CoA synthetase (NDP forming)